MVKKGILQILVSVCILPLFVVDVFAGSVKPFRIESVYQPDFPKIRIVSSFDSSIASKYADLQKSNFTVTVDNQPVDMNSFLPPRIRKEGSATVFLVDRSWSFLSKLDNQKTVLKNYIKKMDWNDQIAIIGFDDEVEPYLLDKTNQPAFSNDVAKIIKAIDSIKPKSHNNLLTARYDAIEIGIKLLSQPTRKNRYLVMITDDNRDEKSKKNGSINSQQLQRIEDNLKKNNLQFYPLIMEDSSPSLREPIINRSLDNIANLSGGKAYQNLKNAQELDQSLMDASVLTFPDKDVEGYTTFFLVHQDEQSKTSQWLEEIQKGLNEQLHFIHVKDRFAIVQQDKKIAVINNPYEIQKITPDALTILNKTHAMTNLLYSLEGLEEIEMIRKYLIIVLPENQKKITTPDNSNEIIQSFQEKGISVCLISKGKITQPFFSGLVRKTYGKTFRIHDDQTYEKGISDFFHWLYNTYTLEYNSLEIDPAKENAVSRVAVTVKKGEEVFKDTFLYFPGTSGFRLPQNNNGKWVLLIGALLLILMLLIFLSFGQQKKRSRSISMQECVHCHKKIEIDSLTCPFCGKAQYEADDSLNDFEPTEYLGEDTKTRVIKKTTPSFAWITLLDRPDQGISYPMDTQKNNTIGRDASNDIVLENDSISKQHAIIFLIGQDYFIQDSASQNNVKVNGKAVDRCQLHDNDQIELGEVHLVFKQVILKKNKN